MSATWSELQLWKAARLETAVDGLVSAEDRIRELDLGLAKADPKSWNGQASEAARAELASLRESLEDRATEIAAVRQALFSASVAVTGILSLRDDALDFAADNELMITDAGVTDIQAPQTYQDQHEADLATDERTRLLEKCAAGGIRHT